MELIRQVGDDIHPSIKLEVDHPSKHPDKKLLVLDLKVWVEHREKEVQGSNQMVSVMIPLLPWANVVEKVEEMVLRMQYSGYNKKFRYEVVDSAIKAYRARQEAETRTSTKRMEERPERNREISEKKED
ncbi:hypothetical protein ACROYT_G036217 [Oculina patagonica]